MSSSPSSFQGPPSANPWTEPPRPRSIYPSVFPRTRSIFTLRPTAHTEQPPPEPRPGRPRRTGGRKWALVASAIAASGVLLAWSFAPGKERSAKAPTVFVNGAPQVKETPTGRIERWRAGDAVTISIDASIDQMGPGAREAVMSAFGTWIGSGATLPKLTFDTTSGVTPSLERDGKNTVMYAPIEIEGHRNDLAITIGFAEPMSGRLLEADIILNSKKDYSLLPLEADGAAHDSPSCNARYDVQSVVTHETGHFFGLDEDLEDGNATMFFKTGKCELKKRDLSEPDSTTMSTLYAGGFDGDAPEPETTTAAGCSVGAAPGQTAGFGALVSALLCSIGIRSARRRNARRDSR